MNFPRSFPGFTRCGTDSAQCIKAESKCNYINDCINGWDESLELCTTPAQQEKFLECNYCSQLVVLINFTA